MVCANTFIFFGGSAIRYAEVISPSWNMRQNLRKNGELLQFAVLRHPKV